MHRRIPFSIESAREDIVNTLRNVSLCISLLALLPSFAKAQDAVICPVAADWSVSSTAVHASGIVCREGASQQIYRFEGEIGAVAPFYTQDGDLRFLLSDSPNGVAFYADDAHLYAVDSTSFKVIQAKNWPHTQKIAQDPFDSSHKAFIHFEESQQQKIIEIVRWESRKITEEISIPVSTEILDVFWTPERLVVLEPLKINIFRRSDTINAENSDTGIDEEDSGTSAQDANADGPWISESIALPFPIQKGKYRLDPNGVMLWDEPNKKLTYYVFDAKRWTRASINATASIYGLGESPRFAMGVTIDASTVRIVARMGQFLQNRFEAKYWKLPKDPENMLVIGQDNLIALDGGADNRAQIIDTTEMTWKRVSLIHYPAPGKLAELTRNELATLHPQSDEVVLFWNVRNGEKIAQLRRNTLEKSGLADIARIKTIDALPRYKVFWDSAQNFALFDEKTGDLSEAIPAVMSPWQTFPLNLAINPTAIVLPHPTQPAAWRIYTDSDDPETRIRTLSRESFANENLKELLTDKDKWYGYRSDGRDSMPLLQKGDQLRRSPQIATIPEPSHRPVRLAWILATLSFVAMIGVMAWRRGVGKKSLLQPNSKDSDAYTPLIDLFDKKNRRAITDRDVHGFLEEKFYAKTLIRFLGSLILSLCIAFAIASPYWFDDTLNTFFSWIAVLAMPIFAILWIIASWTYWNRRYLLQFGNIVEGKWLHCAKPNQSICYYGAPGKAFELTRNQWHRVDFVPIVLFDPARPNFAVQYTGKSEHALTTIDTPKEDDIPQKTYSYDFLRLVIVVTALACIVLATQYLFHRAYPGALSERQLLEMERTTETNASALNEDRASDKDLRGNDEKTTFTTVCLRQCKNRDETCHAQCHKRQLRIILEKAEIPVDGAIDMTPSELLQNRSDAISQARQILFDTTLSCDARAEQIAAIPMWSDDLYVAFFDIYGQRESFLAAGLDKISDNMDNNMSIFHQLCDTKCAQNSETCLTPPSCSGSVERLKSAVCTFEQAIGTRGIPQS